MSERALKNKPLVEAIWEIRWALQQKSPGITSDPHYRLLLGRLYDRLSNQYPEHQQLDTANMPDELSGHIVQHRFRAAVADWPLVQVGPGVVTVNDTSKYHWKDFRERVLDVKSKLYESHPKPGELKIESLVLRYVDAVELNYSDVSVFEFLRDYLKVSIQLPSSLFENTEVAATPHHYQSQQLFRSKRPVGMVRLGLATGMHNDKQSVIWETALHTEGIDIPEMPIGFEDWLDQAHVLINDWFFKMIEGELHRRFSGE